MEAAFICQVDHRVSVQMCGDPSADSIYKCEIIGPSHNDHIVGLHTILHASHGNGYSCSSIQRIINGRN